MGVEVTLVEDFAALVPYKDAWNRLVEMTPTSTVFQTFEWHQSWWETLRGGARLFVLLAMVDQRLVGIAPLMISSRKDMLRSQRVVEFIGPGASDCCDCILDPDYPDTLSSFFAWLHTHRHRWDLLHLSYLPGHDSSLIAMRVWFGVHAYPTDVRIIDNAPTRFLNDPQEDYRAVNKKSIRRHTTRLERQGTLQYHVYDTPEAILPHLDELFQQHMARWAETATPSFFHDENQRVFYRTLVHALAPMGWLHFSIVWFNDIPLALHFGFLYKKRFVIYKRTFHAAYEKNSPGSVIVKCLFEEALEKGWREIDFSLGGEPHKYQFTNYTRQICSLRVFRRRTDAYLYHLVLTLAPMIRRSWGLKRLAHWFMGTHGMARWRSMRWR